MALFDKLFGKGDDASRGGAKRSGGTRVRSAPAPARPAAPPPPPPAASKGQTRARKNPQTATDQELLKRGMMRQRDGDHKGAIADFSKALEMNPELVQAYASRGVSREAQGDAAGAKSDYSRMLQIQITQEINRQMRDNPETTL